MTILFIADDISTFGGAERVITNLANAFAEAFCNAKTPISDTITGGGNN